MNLTRLGAALRERRETLGIPRAEIARRVGVTPTYIWLVEGARPRKGGEPSRPAQALLERWAKALGMDERYARQILLLGGYETGGPAEDPMRPAEIRTTTGRDLTMSSSVPVFEQRTPIQMRAHAQEPRVPELHPFAAAPVAFPQPRDLQTEVILDRVRETLEIAGRSSGDWDESVPLLESFLDWLRFRLETP